MPRFNASALLATLVTSMRIVRGGDAKSDAGGTDANAITTVAGTGPGGRKGTTHRLLTGLSMAGALSLACSCGSTTTDPKEERAAAGAGGEAGWLASAGSGGRDATGGEQVTGGAGATGGQASGGQGTTGGVRATGGARATGGETSTGGEAPTGGEPPSGGRQATGGEDTTGGRRATGGDESAGGLRPTGGRGPSAGASGQAGSPASTGGVDNGGEGGAGAGSGGEAGAGGNGPDQTVTSVFALPEDLTALANEAFFDHPWPSDFRRDANGGIELAGFPNLLSSALLDGYVATADGLDGFSPAVGGALRFTGTLDVASLPQNPLEALEATSSVQLIDIDPASPQRGSRKRISLSFRDTADGYFGAHSLAFLPTPGFPLRPRTRYALVVTDALTANGVPVAACPEVRQVIGVDPATGRAATLRDDWADVVDQLESEANIPRTSIVHLTVFTTSDPAKLTTDLRDWLVANAPSPSVSDLSLVAEDPVLDVYEGSYGPSPDLQEGTPPFLSAGGGIEWGSDDAPVVQRELELRFALTVPSAAACPIPTAGYPVALYAHGTGGDYRTPIANGTAARLAAACIATFSIDQIFHGTRPGGPCAARGYVQPCSVTPEYLSVFNVGNPTSMRFSNPQATLDVVQQARLVTTGALWIPADISATGQPIDFDANRIVLRAHSQGTVNGTLALAVDDQFAGAALSGAGAMLSLSLLERTEPTDLQALIAAQLYPGGATTSLDVFHPALMVIQTALDVGDPLHFDRFIITEPRAGFAPKHLLMIEGVGADGLSDGYVSSHAIEVNALAMGLPPVLPLVAPIAELAWSDLSPVSIPPEGLFANLASGQVTGALSQFAPPDGSDPHFVVFDVPAAAEQTARFLESLAATGMARVFGE